MFFICFLNDKRDLLSLVFCESAPHNSGPLQIKLVVIIGGGGGQGGSLITIHKEKKNLFTFHVENKLNSHFTWN